MCLSLCLLVYLRVTQEDRMEIKATITGIEYQPKLHTELKEISMDDFDINVTPSNFLLKFNKNKLAVSKWVSPKRTRSYPYERVYNTLSVAKKITIIPVVKDEGKTGNRDFIQWDTIALMSLLDVYVIPAYYNDADKRITSKGKEKSLIKNLIINILSKK